MPSRAVKQPNGLYGRFSTIVDDFTHMNYCREGLIQVFYEEFNSMISAEGKLQRADDNPNRFTDEIETIKLIHGKKLANKRLRQMSK